MKEMDICKKIRDRYIELVEERYGELPKHIYDTRIGIIRNRNLEFHHANLLTNTIGINIYCTNDLPWAIFHEMEHIRTANNIYHTMECGVRKSGKDDWILEPIDEAMTEISVANLLGRNTIDRKDYGYIETVMLCRQLFALLGLKTDEQVLNHYKANGYKDFKDLVVNTLGNEDIFYNLDSTLSTFHDRHLYDLFKEEEKFNGIKNVPLGSEPSFIVRLIRKKYQQALRKILIRLREKGEITDEEYERRLYLIKKFSPYNKQLSQYGYKVSYEVEKSKKHL